MPTAGTQASELKSSSVTKICGQDELLAADVITRYDNKKAIVTESLPVLTSGLRLLWQELALTLNTTYLTVFSYNGNGILFGFVIDCNSNIGITFEFIIDGVTIFTELTYQFITDLYGTSYGTDTFLYLGRSDIGDLQFRPPHPIRFNSNITVRAKRTATSKIINRYLAWIQVN